MKCIETLGSLFVLFAIGCGNQHVEKPQPEKPQAGKPQAENLAGKDDDSRTEIPRASKFIFDGRQYRVAKTEIVATIGDPYWCDTYNKGKGKAISWSIGFDAESDDEDKLPRRFVDFEGIEISVKNWHDLVGYEAAWDKPINPETDERYGLFDQQLISAGRVQITGRHGTEFRIVASGENEEGKAFSIDAPAVFKGIYVRGSERDSDETIRARLKEQLDDTNLVGAPFKLDFKYGSGVKAGTAFFSPTTNDR